MGGHAVASACAGVSDAGSGGGGELRVGLVGAGRVGASVLQLLALAPNVLVVAVADPDPDAPGAVFARSQGIPWIAAPHRIFRYSPHIVIEVTGRPEVAGDLARARPPGVEIAGPETARLLRCLVTLRAREGQLLERAETARRMSAGILHSLNNLFTALVGRAALLLKGLDGEGWTRDQVADGLRVMARNAGRGTEMIRRVRRLLRGEADEAVRRVDLNGLVGEVAALAEPLVRHAQAGGAPIRIEEALGQVPAVLGCPSELVEVLTNLVVNAVEAMPAGGLLRLETAVDGGSVAIRVRDTGVGIPDDVKAQLFAPFFTTKPHGTGLGLSVSREIVLRHGGQLDVESAVGEGTAFTIRLPVALDEAERGRGQAGALPGWRVLVIDDDRFIREYLTEMLAAFGWTIVAVGGAEALGALHRERHDLVLADIVMPEITGWQVAQAVRARFPDAVVILFSGWGVEPDDPPLAEVGADAFLAKPIRTAALLDAIRQAARRRLAGGGREAVWGR